MFSAVRPPLNLRNFFDDYQIIFSDWGDWSEMKQGQVETVTITFMGDNA